MTGTAGPVRLEREGDVAVVVLDNPPLDLFDELVLDELKRLSRELLVLTEPGREGRARAVLVEARGKHVSAGVDVGLFAEIADGPDPTVRGAALWARLLRVVQAVEELPVPTVFAAHGLTLTAVSELSRGGRQLPARGPGPGGLHRPVTGSRAPVAPARRG